MKSKVIAILLVAVLLTAVFGITPLIDQKESKEPSINLIVTDSSYEVIEASSYIRNHLPETNLFEVRSKEVLISQIQKSDSEILLFVGHGSQEGLKVSSNVVRWEELIVNSDPNSAELQFFVTCDSRRVKDIPSKKMNIGFEGKIDSYAAAVYTTFFILQMYFPTSVNLLASVFQDLKSDHFIYRKTIDSHPLAMSYIPIIGLSGNEFGFGTYQSRVTLVSSRWHTYWVGVSGIDLITYPSGGSSQLWASDLNSAIDHLTYVLITHWMWWVSDSFIDTMWGMTSTQKAHMYWTSLVMNALYSVLGISLPWWVAAVAIVYNTIWPWISPLVHLILDTITGNPTLASLIDANMNLFGIGSFLMTLLITWCCVF